MVRSYDSIDCYINDGPKFQAKYNDIDLVCDKATLDTLVKNGVCLLAAWM